MAKFTDRFLKVPVKIFNAEENRLTDKQDFECEQIDSYKSILPMRIESYEPAMPAGGGFGIENQTAVSVTMQSGEIFVGFISIDEFEKLLNSHQQS